ncbi:heat-inducible transcription repressor HrcA [Oscillospiraceae bacterium HV4-5-C5C]|nr:heat-inducible transcription repressor HrcA [Oscillospiraceae bacterium HV4-5-C5C]
MALDHRKKDILKVIVDDYIETAEPVGSKYLVSKYHLPVSSATVRNTMSELEQQGYLEQPHTSSGRVPSDKGYREYVENLMQVEWLPPAEAKGIRMALTEQVNEISTLLRRASGVLSETTGYLSVALPPQAQGSQLLQVKLLMIEPGRALIVVVLSAGQVKDRIVRIPDLLSAEDLLKISQAIEANLAGMKLKDITFVAVQSALQGTSLPEPLLNQIMYEAYTAIKQSDNLDSYLNGMPNLFAHPEFQDISRARNVVDKLSQEGLLFGLLDQQWETEQAARQLPQSPAGDPPENQTRRRFGQTEAGGTDCKPCRYMIRIGQELQSEGLEDCSFVTTTYTLPGKLMGFIGVLGPMRMNYSRVISHISFVRQTMDDLIARSARLNRDSHNREQ